MPLQGSTPLTRLGQVRDVAVAMRRVTRAQLREGYEAIDEADLCTPQRR